MRRLLLLTVAGVLAGSAASASAAGPVRVRIDDQGRVCYYTDAIPMTEQCSEPPVTLRDDQTAVHTEPVKVVVRHGGEVCFWAFSLPQECVGRN